AARRGRLITVSVLLPRVLGALPRIGLRVAFLRVATSRVALVRVALVRVTLFGIALLGIALLGIALLGVALVRVALTRITVLGAGGLPGGVRLILGCLHVLRDVVRVAFLGVRVVLSGVSVVMRLIRLLPVLLCRIGLAGVRLFGEGTLGIHPFVRGLGFRDLMPPSSRIPAPVLSGLPLSRLRPCL